MRDDSRQFDLTFASIPVGSDETPLDLTRLLYKGGASVPVARVKQAIRDGLLGDIQSDRIKLVHRIHEVISDDLVKGGSHESARAQVAHIGIYFAWADRPDRVGAALTLSEVQNIYLDWADSLLHRVRIAKDLKPRTAHSYAWIVGHILDGVLERGTPLIELTRLKPAKTRKTPRGVKADKQILHQTFAFGRLLQDICDGTPLRVIWGSYKVRIPLQQGGEIAFAPGREARPENERDPSNLLKSLTAAQAYEADLSLNHRFRREIVNLRIQTELLMFIGQTGMNLTQAQGLTLRNFSYSSSLNGFEVREYKRRAHGEVLFEIFSEYRSHFERYLDWRRELFPDTEKRLFPLIRREGTRKDARIMFESMKAACAKAGVVWTPPSMLRNTRVNWLLRRSGDPDMTAEMAQHAKETLLNVYERPSLQRAISEITRFHLDNDPALAGKDLMLAAGPGECNGNPKPIAAKPESAPAPDCIRPSGCLWCEHHRDIDSLDYVWSVACFRHLKILELSRQPLMDNDGEAEHPAEHVIQRLSEKLSWFRDEDDTRREWVTESLTRVAEGDYHDQWSYLIEPLEGASE
ncbi:site-specific integrase [Noviherbaspirillum sp. Root189]|uniref:site-specific integrase n=1 Tax=Noviherbaspirillum sp. Root189 TaxID=1736487 RepID=UPI00071078C7|nr:site-specific integrase [Noviherbaspirillum sp. Root189]KRB75755.1 hypothetical protein ASE07_26460 [Noviherbaspirillum sp. Root189]